MFQTQLLLLYKACYRFYIQSECWFCLAVMTVFAVQITVMAHCKYREHIKLILSTKNGHLNLQWTQALLTWTGEN